MPFAPNALPYQRYTGVSKPGRYLYVDLNCTAGTVTLHKLHGIGSLIWEHTYIGQILETFPLNELTGTQGFTLADAQAEWEAHIDDLMS